MDLKTYSLFELKQKIKILKKSKKCIGLTNGCFDLLHKGHLKLLNEAKSYCDFLIVALNSDTSVKKLKGKDRPFEKESVRIKNLLNTSFVDAIILFNENTPEEIIHELLPNILVKGGDYRVNQIAGSKAVLNNGGSVKLIDLLEGYSTSNIIKKQLK